MNEKDPIKVCTTDVVRTKRFELMDDADRLRAYATVMDGNAQLIFCDTKGVRRLIIQSGQDCGAEIQLLGDDQACRVAVALTKRGTALVSLMDLEGTGRFKIECDQLGRIIRN